MKPVFLSHPDEIANPISPAEMTSVLEELGDIVSDFIVPAGTPGSVMLTDGDKPDLSNLTTKKLHHATMIADHCCTACACCGQPLSDGLSCQVGMGPTCRSKGFSQEPLPSDPIDAMILLSAWPELVLFLNKHYAPDGNRGLVNRGSEQKDGNEDLFRACCDAVEALGYPKMANLLRNTLVVAWLDKSKEPGEDGVSYLRTKAYRERPPEVLAGLLLGDI